MINKIEQFLLTKAPIVWNIKLVPVALLVIAVQILLFAVGYGTTDTVCRHDYYSGDWFFLVYAGSILTAILIFIFWIIQYNRNNGLKAHYPQSNASLFVEWLMIFGICFIICFIPNALTLGKTNKWKSTVSEQQYYEAMKILTRAEALLPTDEHSFELRSQRPLLVGDADVDRTKFDTKLYTYEEDAMEPDNPIEYVGPSLLYYKENNSYRYYYWDGWEKEVDRVHQWLVAEQRDSIEAAIQAFLDMHKQHKLHTNVDADMWMDIIYHPPLYPLAEGAMIVKSDYTTYDNPTPNYTLYDTLESYYGEVGDNYKTNGFDHWYILVTLTIAMGLSVMVFSARVTSGKSWIFALLSSGVITFVMTLLIGIFSLVNLRDFSGMLAPLLWLTVLVVIGLAITLKVVNGKKKGRSNIYLNLGLWLIPAVLPLCYLIYDYIQDWKKDLYDYESVVVEDSSTILYNLLCADILFTIAIMFPVVMLIRKWKALPED